MNIQQLRSQHKLINLFLDLCEIPSPSLKEYALSEKIMQIFRENNISAEYDEYKNIIAHMPGTEKYKKISPILLSAHMDVVGGSEDVNIRLSNDSKFIETDKTRTLGADNKAGIAAILDLAVNLANPANDIEHGPLEITFTRDEEKGMTGIRKLDTSRLKSKYAIIADGERLGELDTEGAGFTNVFIKVHGGKGGHSGINIHEKDRISAIKVLSGLDSKIPQGVYKSDPQTGVITSINAGVCAGGTADTAIAEIIKEVHELGKNGKPVPAEYSSYRIMETIGKTAALNVITSKAEIAYSIRSSEPDNRQELINLINSLTSDLNKRYKELIHIDVEIQHHLEPFVKSDDDFLSNVIIKAGKNLNMNCIPSSFHAGAETHILSNEKKNFYDDFFNPVIVGVANLENIHSSDEKIDWQSFLQGRKWLEEIVIQFAEEILVK